MINANSPMTFDETMLGAMGATMGGFAVVMPDGDGMGVDDQCASDIPDPFENMRTGLYMIRARAEDATILSPYDMLRFHTFTVGWGWKGDYGSSETREGFATLMTYSPLHTLKPGTQYPPTLVTTGDHDDRVVPAHSHKFTATLQACQAGPAPVLTRIETSAGHGAGKPTAKAIAERADVLAFLVQSLGMKGID